ALSPENRAGSEAVPQNIEMPHSVQQRQDRRVRADRRSERPDRAREVVGLTAQQNEPEVLAHAFRGDGRWRRQPDVALRAANRQSLPQLRLTLGPHQKGRVDAGLHQPGTEVGANRAGADNQYLHRATPREHLIGDTKTVIVEPYTTGAQPRNGPGGGGDRCGVRPIAAQPSDAQSDAPTGRWPRRQRVLLK